MGSVGSACKDCFGETPSSVNSSLNLKYRPMKRRSREKDQDDAVDAIEAKDDSPASADDAPLKNPQRSEEKGPSLTINDFTIMKVIGEGSFGKVYLVQKKDNKKFFALKSMKKKDLLLKNLLNCVLNEKNILRDIEHPFVVQLKYSFQNEKRVYMVMDYCPGGDLAVRRKKEGSFSEKIVKFYTAEIVLALQYLHENLNIIHRDIKPENILITADGHIKITDFGLAKTKTKALTLCGTPDYLAPEIIFGRAYGRPVDWWSLGCLIYEMLTGETPFYNESNRESLIDNIITAEPRMKSSFSSPLKDLISRLLVKNPNQRLGFKGAEEVKRHPFFKDIDWEAMLHKRITPPLRVPVEKIEERKHKRVESNVSVPETPMNDINSQNKYNYDFPHFSYVGKDPTEDQNSERFSK